VAAKKKKTATKRGRGRPPLPAAERSARTISVRLLPRDIAILSELVEDCGRSEGEVVRAAIAELSANKAARARLRAGTDIT
jgi:hypothetical protein